MASNSRHGTAYVVWFLLVGSLLPWRQGEYYDGGVDSVVIGKALMQLLALLVAVVALRRPPVGRVGGRSLLLVLLFIGVSCIGALAVGDVVASMVLAVRVVLLALTITALLYATSARMALSSLLTTMGCFGIGSAVSGIGLLASTGRLAGVVPPLSANAIALLCALPALGLLHELLHSRLHMGQLFSFLGLLLVLFATESRTAIFGFFLAAFVLFFYIRTLKPSVAVTVLIAVPLLSGVLLYTSAVQNLAVREEGGSIQTLNSRTIAWNAVLQTPSDTWERWVGAGLSVKTVAVDGQYWNQQVLDSSWISGLAQAGLIGVSVMILWVVLSVYAGFRAPALRSLAPAIMAFILTRSVLENGLVEASTTFLVFFTVAMLSEAPDSVDETDLKAQRPGRLASGSEPNTSYSSTKAPR